MPVLVLGREVVSTRCGLTILIVKLPLARRVGGQHVIWCGNLHGWNLGPAAEQAHEECVRSLDQASCSSECCACLREENLHDKKGKRE